MNFLLLHGAWHGGWAWDEVAQRLRAQGHHVEAPDLPGLGKDAGNLSRSIGLEDHIRAVVPSAPTIICAHSYGGMVAHVIADRRPDLVSSMVLIEALWPEEGQCAFDLVADGARHLFVKRRDEEGDGWRMPSPDPRHFHLGNAQLERMVKSRMTDHPAKTFEESVVLKSRGPTGTYVIATDREPQSYSSIAGSLRKKGWQIVETTGGHELMLTQPELVTNILIKTTSNLTIEDIA